MEPSAELKSEQQSWVLLQDDPLDLAAAHQFLQHPEAGGIALFLGTTRGVTAGKETLRLAYECYEDMAREEMLRLVGSACKQWPVIRVCLFHRFGTVPVCEASVLVGVACAHRAPAFEACRFLIDTLKTSVPIWKKEYYADGESTWVKGSGD